MEFLFVDSHGVSKQSRRLIRSHVMKGKNLGKTVHRPSRRSPVKLPAAQAAQPVTKAPETKEQNAQTARVGQDYPISGRSSGMANTVITFPVGHGFSSVGFTIEVDPYMRRFITHFFTMLEASLYPPEICLLQNRSIWLHYMMTDEVFLHCTLATVATCAERFYGIEAENSPEALMYLSKAFRLLNEKLSSPRAVWSDEIVASIVSLGIRDQLRGDYGKGRVHLDGLLRIVSLRGGFHRVTKVELVQKICRTDIDVSLHDGTRPKLQYSGPDRLLPLPAPSRWRNRSHLSELILERPDSSVLDSIILDLHSIMSHLNQACMLDKLSPQVYQGTVLALCYRLLELSPLNGPRPADPLVSAVHIGLTAFMTTFVIPFGRRRRVRFAALSTCLTEAIQNQTWTFGDANQKFLVWLLVISGMTMFDQEDRIWLLPMIRHTAIKLGIGSWDDLRTYVMDYPWVMILHDNASKELWHEANRLDLR